MTDTGPAWDLRRKQERKAHSYQHSSSRRGEHLSPPSFSLEREASRPCRSDLAGHVLIQYSMS